MDKSQRALVNVNLFGQTLSMCLQTSSSTPAQTNYAEFLEMDYR